MDSQKKIEAAVNALNQNKIKISKNFAYLLQGDFEGNDEKYAFAEQLADDVYKLTFEGVNHGFNMGLNRSIIKLTSMSDTLVKPINMRKLDGLKDDRRKIMGLFSKKSTNGIDIKGPLQEMVNDTLYGVQILSKVNEDEKELFDAAKKSLEDLSAKLETIWDNSSKEAASKQKEIFEIVYKEVRKPFGQGIQTYSRLNKAMLAANKVADEWAAQTKSGLKPAKIEEIYGFKAENENDIFFVATNGKLFQENFKVFAKQISKYEEQTNKLCNVDAMEAKRDDLTNKINKLSSDMKTIQANLQAGKISKENALAMAKDIKARVVSMQQEQKMVNMKIQSSGMVYRSRMTIVNQLKDISDKIEASQGDVFMSYVYYNEIKLDKISQLLSGVETNPEVIQEALKVIRTILETDHKQRIADLKKANEMNAVSQQINQEMMKEMEALNKEFIDMQTENMSEEDVDNELGELFGEFGVETEEVKESKEEVKQDKKEDEDNDVFNLNDIF